MKLIEIDKNTEDTFFRCMHDEVPADPRVIEIRRRWYKQNKEKGLRAKVLLRDDNSIVGLCQYIPIERSHLIGKDLMAILCIWVHGYEHLVGNQQGKGYGTFILKHIENDARASGKKGVVAWGMDFPYWNPASFYEHMGYTRVETDGMVVLVWKPFQEDVTPPELLRQTRAITKDPKKPKITVFANGWCGIGCENCISARDAIAGLENLVTYEEIDTSDREHLLFWGIEDGVFLDGKPFRPNGPPWTSEKLKAEILQLLDKESSA